ncbi:hypothetical protein WN944_018882 [Citrus x changshan-huyou]|uniref:Uncharacterized protein n=1 Tax=Citrus x changshan-huyou TaxID=2935761 RepID=A0AAP0LV77_9ROSI
MSYANKEVTRLVDSSDDDIELGTVQLTNYLQQYEYKVGADAKHRLKLGHMFRDVGHFREILHEGQVTVDPNVRIDILKNHVQETYGLKIGKMTLYRARAKARLEVFGDHSRGYKKLFDYAAAIHKANPGAVCKTFYWSRWMSLERACSRHVYVNFSKSFVGAQLKQLFWKAAKSSNKHDFDEAMAEIKAEKEAEFE